MPKFDLARGDDAIAFSNTFDNDPSLQPGSENVRQIIESLINKSNDLEVLVQGKVAIGQIKSEIAIGSELIKIQASEVVVVGAFTVVDLVDDQNGTASGILPARLTRIIGDKIQTGIIISNNFSGSEGTQIDLDNDTITMGGSVAPSLFYDGAGNLSMTGTLEAGSIIASSIAITGSAIIGVIQSAGFGASEGTEIDLVNETIKFGGSSAPELFYDGAGNLTMKGTLQAGSIIASSIEITGAAIVGVIQSAGFGASEGVEIDLINETMTFGGSSSPTLFYDGAGNLDLSGNINAGSIIVNSVTVDGVTMGTISSNSSTGATHAGVSGSNPHNVPLSTISGDLDDIDDSSTFFRSTADQNTGGTRGFNALDSSFDYIRGISTTRIVVSESNPANGMIIDSTGLRGFASSALTVNISTTGDSTWSGNLTTSGQVKATGVDSGGANASIVAIPDSASVIGIAVIKDVLGTATGIDSINSAANQLAIRGVSIGPGGVGVQGRAQIVTGHGVEAINTAAGTALLLGSPKIENDANFLDDVDIDLTLVVGGITTLNGVLNVNADANFDQDVVIDLTLGVTGISTFSGVVNINADLNVGSNSNITVDRTLKAATDAIAGDSSITIGGATVTGKNTLVIKEGTIGGRTANQFHFFGALDSGQSKTTVGIATEADVESGTGAFAGIVQIPVIINGTRYKWPLEAY